MFDRLLKQLKIEPREPVRDHRLAVAVLLLECARADFDQSEVEIIAVRDALRQEYGLAEEELETLIGSGGAQAREAISLHDTVAQLNEQMSPDEKRQLMAMLWRVAYADDHLDPQEEHLLRRLADLLYVPHADFVREKLAASKN
ncbi:MAG: TerB family tellurite resistance protein [Panacagrimonas sp.]